MYAVFFSSGSVTLVFCSHSCCSRFVVCLCSSVKCCRVWQETTWCAQWWPHVCSFNGLLLNCCEWLAVCVTRGCVGDGDDPGVGQKWCPAGWPQIHPVHPARLLSLLVLPRQACTLHGRRGNDNQDSKPVSTHSLAVLSRVVLVVRRRCAACVLKRLLPTSVSVADWPISKC